LERRGEPGDRRVIRILLTDKGRAADELHRQFHRQMLDRVAQRLDEAELDVLLRSLDQLDQCFNDMARQGLDLHWKEN
jgi:DNA-binding MarR family transcriptional regulator